MMDEYIVSLDVTFKTPLGVMAKNESEAERKGWATDSKIMYPSTPEGEAWAGRYEAVCESPRAC